MAPRRPVPPGEAIGFPCLAEVLGVGMPAFDPRHIQAIAPAKVPSHELETRFANGSNIIRNASNRIVSEIVQWVWRISR